MPLLAVLSLLFLAQSAATSGSAPQQPAATQAQQPPADEEKPNIPARRDSIDVHDTVEPAPLEQSASGNTAPASIAKEVPGRPPTVADALPLIPGVIRQPGGGLSLSGAGEHRSAMMVNSADVTDPATGQFGLTVPIDSVETMSVYQTPFLAEYGRFTGGVVAVETRRGGDKWKWDLNDPLPEFNIRSWHLRGLRAATPRLNVEGPIIKGKLYFSEGLEYTIRKTPVYELPFPFNQKKQSGVNSFAQLDWLISEKQIVTATVHVAPQRLQYVNMNYFNPQATTPDATTDNYTATLVHHLTIGPGQLDTTASATRFDAAVWAQGTAPLNIAPEGNTGNYFAEQSRRSTRAGIGPMYSFNALRFYGEHSFKIGVVVARSSDDGGVTERPFNILDAENRLLATIQYSGGHPFRSRDLEYAAFAQDHWSVTSRLSFDFGARLESQALSESLRIAPRAGVSWLPFGSRGPEFRAGFGLFYDRVPLNVYSFADYPDRIYTTYGPDGEVTGGPWLFTNGLGTVNKKVRFVYNSAEPGNFSPQTGTGNVQIEQAVTEHLRLRLGYTQKESNGLVILTPAIPGTPNGFVGANLLSGTGASRYHQIEATARLKLNEKRQLFVSYVRSRARGDLNDFAEFIGTFPVPIIRGDQYGNLATNMPNRFLAWGSFDLPKKIRIAPLVEIRNGFPYSNLTALQGYSGVPNSQTFPNFISIDGRVSKDFQVNPKYAARFSVSMFNLTNHFNPEAVHNNIADPAFGYFFGHRGRRFTLDFDVLF